MIYIEDGYLQIHVHAPAGNAAFSAKTNNIRSKAVYPDCAWLTQIDTAKSNKEDSQCKRWKN